jgi:hypothetical protein
MVKQIGAAASTISPCNFICLAISLPLPSCHLSVQWSLSEEEMKELQRRKLMMDFTVLPLKMTEADERRETRVGTLVISFVHNRVLGEAHNDQTWLS